MIKVKKIPLRKCVVTQELLPKKELLRVVKNKEGEVFVDESGRANGRGAYLKKEAAVIELAKRKNALAKALEIAIPESIYEELLKKI
ncbi:YlxR family protein [bacterium]|jgi:predicted RNA-binding protein YlxR (DUF448 family)|nr:YlxR family protein [bacterium]